MNQSHHAEPSPYIHSNVRRYVAPEMQDKRIKPVGHTKPAGKRVSVHELSRIQPQDSYQDDYFKAKVHSYNIVNELIKQRESGDWQPLLDGE